MSISIKFHKIVRDVYKSISESQEDSHLLNSISSYTMTGLASVPFNCYEDLIDLINYNQVAVNKTKLLTKKQKNEINTLVLKKDKFYAVAKLRALEITINSSINSHKLNKINPSYKNVKQKYKIIKQNLDTIFHENVLLIPMFTTQNPVLYDYARPNHFLVILNEEQYVLSSLLHPNGIVVDSLIK